MSKRPTAAPRATEARRMRLVPLRPAATARRRAFIHDREKCRACGYLRVNVRHEPDPDNAPEGKAYFDAMRDELHAFVPSGEFEDD